MTISNIIGLVILGLSIPLVILLVRRSNQMVEDLDGLGEIAEKKDDKDDNIIKL